MTIFGYIIGKKLGDENWRKHSRRWIDEEWRPVIDILDTLNEELGLDVTVDCYTMTIEDRGGEVIAQFKNFEELKHELNEIRWDYEAHLLSQHMNYNART
jgi:hypothetical protein